MNTDLEQSIMNLIVYSGAARSQAMEAVVEAENANMEGAEKKLKEARDEINKAHKIQTELICGEAGGNSTPISLIIIHGQDHLMNALTVIDMAELMVNMYKKMNNNK